MSLHGLKNMLTAVRALTLKIPLPARRRIHPPVRLSYPLDGLVGYFPKVLAKRPIEIHVVNQVVEHLRPGYVCLDVGANMGYFTLLFARYGKQVYAFEPVPDNLRLLQYNVALNGLKNVSIQPKAVGAAGSKTVKIYVRQPGLELQASALTPTSTYFEVEQVSIDAFCEANGLRPDMVKIDVEGYEVEVLKGMTKVLAETKPVLFLEIHAGILGEGDRESLIQGIREKGYKIYSWAEDVEGGGFGHWRHLFEVESARDMKVGNVLALPQDRYSGLLSKEVAWG